MEDSNGNIRFLSVISYIGVLFVIGHFAVEKNNPDLRFHTFQGGILFAVFGVLYFLDFLLYLLLSFIPEVQLILCFLLTIAVSVAYIMLAVMGMINAFQFRQKLLPFVGSISVTLRTKLDGLGK